MIYIFDDYENVSEQILNKLTEALPSYRKRKALSYKNAADRISCAVSYKLLEYGLKKEFGIDQFELYTNKYGKPYLSCQNSVLFNLSHCKKGCVCAISFDEIGIDIQDIRPINYEIIERVCSEAEYKSIANAKDSLREFIKIWTMKEAYLKMLGIGISTELKRIDTTVLKSKIVCREFEKYIVAVATEGEIEDAKVQLDHAAEKHLELADLL